MDVDIIVTSSTPVAQAAKQATTTVPIVMTFVADPVGSGLVASLARPGGNVTGLSTLAAGLVAKRLEVLKAVASTRVKRMAALWQPGVFGENTIRSMREETEGAEVGPYRKSQSRRSPRAVAHHSRAADGAGKFPTTTLVACAVVWSVIAPGWASGGTIKGTVKFTGAPIKQEMLAVTADHFVCGREKAPETLLLSAAKGIRYAVVSLRNPPAGVKWPGPVPPVKLIRRIASTFRMSSWYRSAARWSS
jgi:hypothetical protein